MEMETTTFFCPECGWVSSKPYSFRVSGGHSYWPIRDLCRECFDQRKHSVTVSAHKIVPKPEFFQLTDENQLFTSEEAADLLNFPERMNIFLFYYCKLNLTNVPREYINGRWIEHKVTKKELDALIYRVNLPSQIPH